VQHALVAQQDRARAF